MKVSEAFNFVDTVLGTKCCTQCVNGHCETCRLKEAVYTIQAAIADEIAAESKEEPEGVTKDENGSH